MHAQLPSRARGIKFYMNLHLHTYFMCGSSEGSDKTAQLRILFRAFTGQQCNKYKTSRLECVIENYFSYFSTKTYVVGAQKNRLNETVLLHTQNICLNGWVRNKCQFYAKHICFNGHEYQNLMG